MSQWDRIGKKAKKRGETSNEFAAFQAYLSLGLERSIRKASGKSAAERNKSPTALLAYWEKLSMRWKWVERAAAYDADLAAAVRRSYRERVQQLSRRRADFEFKLQEKLEANTELLDIHFRKLLATPTNDVVQEKADGTINQVKGTRQADIALLHKEMRETATKAVTGVRPAELPDRTRSTPGSVPGTFTFVKPRKKALRDKRDDA